MKQNTQGWINGFVGVTIFAGSLPATRIAVLDFSPVFLTSVRASIAALLGLFLLCLFRVPFIKKHHIPSLLIVSIGVVIGFPLLTAFALQYISASQSIVYVGLLPLCTAIFAVIRSGERPQNKFWLYSMIGALFVIGYALIGTSNISIQGSILMLMAVIVCALGYAEGAQLTHSIGGWQVICWALLISLPIMVILACLTTPMTFDNVSTRAWWGLGYVSVFSMLLGFVFWYKGLAQGGIAAVAQLQLLQPFIGMGLAVWLLYETISWTMIGVTIATLFCVFSAKKYA